MSDRQSLKAEYVTTVRRPGIEYLNPAVERSPFRVQQGNAALRSSRQQGLYLIYMYMGRRLTLNLAPAVKWSRDGIGPVLTTQGDVHYQTYGNVIDHRRLQLEGYLQWRPWDKTTVAVNANLGQDRYENGQLALHDGQSGLRLSRFSGFIYGYVKGLPLEKCQELGNLTGAVNTTAPGGTGAFRTREDVERTAWERFGKTLE